LSGVKSSAHHLKAPGGGKYAARAMNQGFFTGVKTKALQIGYTHSQTRPKVLSGLFMKWWSTMMFTSHDREKDVDMLWIYNSIQIKLQYSVN
jgi:hypothetical protein